MNARLRVDFIACAGRGICAEMLPELITLDDWGFPVVSDQPVPAHLLPDARVTAHTCPMLALHVDEEKNHRSFGHMNGLVGEGAAAGLAAFSWRGCRV